MDAPAEHSLAALPRSRRSGPAPWQATLAKLVRRTHLYSGLALVPFVLVYGVSAFLFNHPVGRAPEAAPIPVAEGLRAAMPDAEALAAEAATQLGDGAPLAGSASLRGAWTFDFGRLLMRLHTAHGYGGGAARVLWAIVVDAMAAAMVLWALSGLFMWWQKRSSRRSGGIVLAGTVVGSIVLVVAMAEVFGA